KGCCIHAVAFSPDGKTLASADEDQRGLVKLWDLGSGRVRAWLAGHPGPVLSVAFSPDGKVLATVSNLPAGDRQQWQDATGQVRLWDAVSGRPLGTPLTLDHQAVSVAFGARGKLLAVGGSRGRYAEVT